MIKAAVMLTNSLTFPRVKFHTQGLFGLGHLAQRKAQNHADLCVCCTSILWECEDSWNPQRCIVCQKAYALLRGSLNRKTHTDRKFDFLLHWNPPLSPASFYPRLQLHCNLWPFDQGPIYSLVVQHTRHISVTLLGVKKHWTKMQTHVCIYIYFLKS